MESDGIFQGKLVIFEGISGSGKSTQIERLKNRISSVADTAVISCEGVYPMLRAVRPRGDGGAMKALQEAMFFQFMYWIRFRDEAGARTCLVDRFLISNFVYTLAHLNRMGMQCDPNSVCSHMRPFGLDIFANTMTVYLRCDPGAAAARRALMSRERQHDDDAIQREVTALYDKVFEKIESPHLIVEVSHVSVDEVGEQIAAGVQHWLS